MSSGSRVALEPAYLLHRRAYRETSLLIDVFSRSYGRVGMVARGARRLRGQAALLQPFRPLVLSWGGRGELVNLVAVEESGRAHVLAGRALYGGFYLNELVTRVLARNDPHPELFHSYHEALLDLVRAPASEVAFRIFEKRLLESIGYGLLTDADAHSGEPLEPGRRYVYRLETGPSRSHPEPGGVEIGGAALIALGRESLSSVDELHDAKRLMRYLLRPYLGDRALHSRALFGNPL